MDVKKVINLLCVGLFITACSKKNNGAKEFSKAEFGDCINQSIDGQKIIRWKSGKLSRLLVGEDRQAALKEYIKKHKKEIEFVEDNYKVSLPKQPQNNFSLARFEVVPNWGIKNIRANDVWDDINNGHQKLQDVTVAVIDSGIDTTHPQLANRLFVNKNEIAGDNIDNDGNGLVDDVHGYDFINDSGNLNDYHSGHGTHVSGIIAADHRNGSVLGVAPNAKILSYDFFGKHETGGDVFHAIKAIRHAEKMGAKVINASWGGRICSQALKETINELSSKNILFVTASGNDGDNLDFTPSYPASFVSSSQITVAASTIENLTAGFSNIGSSVQLVAPGEDIVSTFPTKREDVDGNIVNSGTLTTPLKGTSMSAPFVAGSAALLFGAFPQATASQIKEALMSSVTTGPFPVTTRGRLNVSLAYDYLKDQFSTPLP